MIETTRTKLVGEIPAMSADAPEMVDTSTPSVNIGTERVDGETEAEYVDRVATNYLGGMGVDPAPALKDRVFSFVRAMASKLFEPPAADDVIAARLAVCYGCEAFTPTIAAPALIGHCKACGCKPTALSSVASKSRILLSTCPRQLWDVDPNAISLPLAE